MIGQIFYYNSLISLCQVRKSVYLEKKAESINIPTLRRQSGWSGLISYDCQPNLCTPASLKHL